MTDRVRLRTEASSTPAALCPSALIRTPTSAVGYADDCFGPSATPRRATGLARGCRKIATPGRLFVTALQGHWETEGAVPRTAALGRGDERARWHASTPLCAAHTAKSFSDSLATLRSPSRETSELGGRRDARLSAGPSRVRLGSASDMRTFACHTPRFGLTFHVSFRF